MAVSTFSIRMDENLKKQFDALCDDFGMNATTAFNIFARAVVREKRIPFSIEASDEGIRRAEEIAKACDPFYSDDNMDYVIKSVRELRDGKGTPHVLIEVEEDE